MRSTTRTRSGTARSRATSRAAAPRAARGARRPGRSRRPGREMRERLAVALRALAEHAVRDDVGEHRVTAPLLALLDVRQVHLHDRPTEELERVADRVAVV